MPDIPNTNANGYVLYSQGNGTNASYWSAMATPTNKTFEVAQSYMVSGTIRVPSGSSGYLPPFFVPVMSGTTVTLDRVIGMVRNGNVTMDIQQNGTTVTGLGSISFPTVGITYPAGVSVADGDYFQPVATFAIGSPDGLSLTFVFRITV
jgi:hypothetical protein